MKKWIVGLSIIGSLCMMGCLKTPNENSEVYLRCNDTSNGQMAEEKDGYFFAKDSILYYADKSNLEQWVPVCNKPDCAHEGNVQGEVQERCNAYNPLDNCIWQNGEKLYGIMSEYFWNSCDYSIYEISTDGSGLKNVYDIPIEQFVTTCEEFHPGVDGTFQDAFIIDFYYLDEYGEKQYNLIGLEQDEKGMAVLKPIYQGTDPSSANSGNQYWSIRGDNVIVDRRFLQEGQMLFDSICMIKNDEVIPLNLPDDVNPYGGYLKGDIFIYYSANEGFYEYDISTGKRKLIFKNQMENGQGYVLSEDCIVESNRYLGSMPEDAYLKVYDGEQWIDVRMPEEIINRDNPFYPLCIASDRIFFKMSVESTTFLYYIMLGDKNPELVFAGKIGDDILKEPTVEQETEAEDTDDVYAKFKEMTIFEADGYVCKITDVYLSPKYCCVDLYVENKTEDTTYVLNGNLWTINGIQCNTAWGAYIEPGEIREDTVVLQEGTGRALGDAKISEAYPSNAYTDIGIGFYLETEYWKNETIYRDKVEETLIHVYPQGENMATTYTREAQDTDIVMIDNEQVSIVITGYETGFVPNDTVNVIITNKTDSYIQVSIDEAYANGIIMEKLGLYDTLYDVILSPKAIALYPMALFDKAREGSFHIEPSKEFFTKNNITEVEKIEMHLQVKYYSYDHWVEDYIVDENIVLEP